MNAKIFLIVACAFLFLSLGVLQGYTPDIQPGIKIKDGSGGLKVPNHSALNNPWDFVSNPAAIEIVP